MNAKNKKILFEISDKENLTYIRTHLKLLFNDLSDIENEPILNLEKNFQIYKGDLMFTKMKSTATNGADLRLKAQNDHIQENKKEKKIILRKRKNIEKDLKNHQTLE
jgi:hypothetical protein